METLLQWSLPAQALPLPSSAVLTGRVSLHVSLCVCELQTCNIEWIPNAIDAFYSVNAWQVQCLVKYSIRLEQF